MKKIINYLLVTPCAFLLVSTSLYANTQNKMQITLGQESTLSCSVGKTSKIYKDKVIWQTLTCDGYLFSKIAGKLFPRTLNINVVYAPVNDPEIQIIPYHAQTENQLAKLPEIANSLSSEYTVISGINGGYFFRNDSKGFNDNICLDKNTDRPKPGDSMGDSLLQHHGVLHAVNCALTKTLGKAFEQPRSVLVLTGANAPYITFVDHDKAYTIKDKQGKEIYPDAFGAGPNLVTDGKLDVSGIPGMPSHRDENLFPTIEFSANAAVGIINDAGGKPAQFVFFTVDGNNNSFIHPARNLGGMNAQEMAELMIKYLKVSNAISMDQGGSTTLYIAASDPKEYPLNVVSNSDYKGPGVPRDPKSVRNIYDGLFIAVKK